MPPSSAIVILVLIVSQVGCVLALREPLQPRSLSPSAAQLATALLGFRRASEPPPDPFIPPNPHDVFDYAHIHPPHTVDWRDAPDVLGPIKNQHANDTPCGCCWAFAAVAAVEAVHGLMYGERVALSEQQLVSCDHDTPEDIGCGGGDYRTGMRYVARHGGLAAQADYPYEGQDSPCREDLAHGPHRVSVSGYRSVPPHNATALMQAVSQQPVATAVCVGLPFIEAWHAYRGGVLDPAAFCNSDATLDHAMLVVGYGQEDGTPYWLLKNSWGADWGEAGFLKVRRDYGEEGGAGPLAMLSMPAYPVIEESWAQRVRTAGEVARRRRRQSSADRQATPRERDSGAPCVMCTA